VAAGLDIWRPVFGGCGRGGGRIGHLEAKFGKNQRVNDQLLFLKDFLGEPNAFV
jgi:hypothetical protein